MPYPETSRIQLPDDSSARSFAHERLPMDDRIPCAQCGYNLRGLASAGPCPECGLEMTISREMVGTWLSRGMAQPIAGALQKMRDTLLRCMLAYIAGGWLVAWTQTVVGTVALVGKGVVFLACAGLLLWHDRAAQKLLASLPPREGDARWRLMVTLGIRIMIGVSCFLALLSFVQAVPGLITLTNDMSRWVRRATTLAFVLGFACDALGLQWLLRPVAATTGELTLAHDFQSSMKWSRLIIICVVVTLVVRLLTSGTTPFTSFLSASLSTTLFFVPLFVGIHLFSRTKSLQKHIESLLKPMVHVPGVGYITSGRRAP